MTVTELLLTTTLFGIFATIAVPQLRHGMDRIKVRSAREAAYGVATQARALALARGGAELVLDPQARSISAVDPAGVIAARADLTEYDVEIGADGVSSARIVLRYDAHGIGRMASRTVRFRRRDAIAGLTFSSFGRARRW